jgi:hypothetical protein
LIIHCPEPIVGKELVALAVNLSTNGRNAERFAQEEQLDELIREPLSLTTLFCLKCAEILHNLLPLPLRLSKSILNSILLWLNTVEKTQIYKLNF